MHEFPPPPGQRITLANWLEGPPVDAVMVKFSSLPRAVVEFAEENILLGFHAISKSFV